MTRFQAAFARVFTAVLVAGCYTGGPLDPEPRAAAGHPSGVSMSASGGAPAAGGGGKGSAATAGAPSLAPEASSELPCEVEELLARRCRSCHGRPPSAPVALVTYADLTAPAVTNPGRSVAEVALERMTTQTMPPAPAAPVVDSELAAFRSWVEGGLTSEGCRPGGAGGASSAGGGAGAPNGGLSAGTASGGASPGPGTTSVCTSKVYWSGDEDDDDDDDGDDDDRGSGGGELDEEGPWMNPGEACIRCHLDEEDEPLLQLGGTVYPTFYEPDSCFGVDGRSMDAEVVITDDAGNTFRLPLERTGNFSLSTDERAIRFPIRAKVVSGNRERVMSAAQASGDCNGCHTERGSNGAPGRITLP